MFYLNQNDNLQLGGGGGKAKFCKHFLAKGAFIYDVRSEGGFQNADKGGGF